jgi:UDP-N-acetylglucosamine enolpyruvyl transferase
MDYLEIKGGNPLKGEVRISGSKNAVLPILAATLLTDERCVIRGIPDLSDVKHMAKILQTLGAEWSSNRAPYGTGQIDQSLWRLRYYPQDARLGLHHGSASGAAA